MPKIEATNGVWLNSRLLLSMGLPVKHVFEDGEADVSWRIAIDGTGELVIRYVDGQSESFVVKRGDEIVAIEDHLYASFAVRPGTPPAALESPDGEIEGPAQTQGNS